MIDSVAGPSIARIYEDCKALFDGASHLVDGVPNPRVTLDLPGADPEPLHVFVWGTARDFGVASMLTGSVLQITWHVYVTAVATASDELEAARIANVYQSILLQIPLVDTTLGGTVVEIGVPQVKESESWADAVGRRHSGYLLDFEMSKNVCASAEARTIIEEMIR